MMATSPQASVGVRGVHITIQYVHQLEQQMDYRQICFIGGCGGLHVSDHVTSQ